MLIETVAEAMDVLTVPDAVKPSIVSWHGSWLLKFCYIHGRIWIMVAEVLLYTRQDKDAMPEKVG